MNRVSYQFNKSPNECGIKRITLNNNIKQMGETIRILRERLRIANVLAAAGWGAVLTNLIVKILLEILK